MKRATKSNPLQKLSKRDAIASVKKQVENRFVEGTTNIIVNDRKEHQRLVDILKNEYESQLRSEKKKYKNTLIVCGLVYVITVIALILT